MDTAYHVVKARGRGKGGEGLGGGGQRGGGNGDTCNSVEIKLKLKKSSNPMSAVPRLRHLALTYFFSDAHIFFKNNKNYIIQYI